MILLYTFLFIAVVAFISWWINYVPKMPLIPQETVKKCLFCLRVFDEERLFMDCDGKQFISNIFENKSHQFTIYGTNFYLYVYCDEFTIKLEKVNDKHVICIKDKLVNVPPFEICNSVDVIAKYLKLISFS